ncbi:PQQ-like beta-propeller repeat protein [Meridianimarinicoccus sp. MJW13]|uniref:PQQ-like beta-propeller repeat protein n=1 Tax=Meridianimarinicoccus sp. MJW13 TaxID=2720031 RepID=UPI00186868FC|nr:PQQ-like beta-propeller repeat protein [Fluviibacterium sp. MJW13]
MIRTETSVSRRPRGRSLALLACVLAGVTACGPDEELLPGDRFDLRDVDEAQSAYAESVSDGSLANQQEPAPLPKVIPNAPYTVTGESRATGLPGARANADWPTVNGSNTHQITQPALGSPLTQVWRTKIGSASTRRARMTADPVVGGGRVFTLTAFAQLQATAPSGAVLWQRDLTPEGERPGEAAGGGVTYADGRLYVNSPYGRLQVIDATSGTPIWEQRLGSVPNGAPVVSGGIVYLTTRDSQAWAIDIRNGRVLWQVLAQESGSVVNFGATPAVTSRSVIFPFGSNDVISVLRQGGVRLWSTTVSGQRPGRAYTAVSDISASPVVVGNRLYVGTNNGRLAALDAASGERIWTAQDGAVSAVWPEGNSIYFLSDQAELIRINAADGKKIWSATLPLFTKDKVKKRRGVFAHYGPVLAGGRLIIVSSDGLLREVDPASGQLLRTIDLGAPAAVNPIVAGRTLYVVTTDGQLHAFR